ncbi:DUF1700 domain-containing protein [Bacillus horti]|uniref:Membrane protein n=1 Tax=Caldalkalibacillus horti TaxID=77523 RepID=A0ABT9W078_9BACI|nr:DUF1700 domain-containing protein [Bacillus horti]MDQ0166663.1 putative membrane protein [Bacillus horti]
MNKHEYLAKLKEHLDVLNKFELRELLLDYEAHFDSGVRVGKTEEEIANDLGNPVEVAKEIIAERFEYVDQTPVSERGPVTRTLIIIGLVFLNLCLAIPLGLSIWAVWLSFSFAAAALIASPVLLFIELVFSRNVVIAKIFIAMLSSGLGIFLGLGMRNAYGKLRQLTNAYITWNKNMMGDK